MLRAYLQTAPWWVVGAVQGTIFGLPFGIFTGLQHGESWVGVVITVLVSGAAFGLAMGLVVRRQRRRQPYPVPDLDLDRRRAAERAAVRGPVPTDADARREAAALTRHQLQLMARGRPFALVVFSVFLVLALLAAVTAGGWLYWVGAVLMAGMLAQIVLRPRRLQQRLVLLTGQDGDDAAQPENTRDDTASQHQYTSWGRRACGGLVDYGPPTVLFLAVYLPFGFGVPSVMGGTSGLVIMLSVIAVCLAYQVLNSALRQGRTGQSLGKSVTGTVLVDATTLRPLGVPRAFGRLVAHLVDSLLLYLGWLLPLVDRRHQTLADMVVDSVVLAADDPALQPH